MNSIYFSCSDLKCQILPYLTFLLPRRPKWWQTGWRSYSQWDCGFCLPLDWHLNLLLLLLLLLFSGWILTIRIPLLQRRLTFDAQLLSVCVNYRPYWFHRWVVFFWNVTSSVFLKSQFTFDLLSRLARNGRTESGLHQSSKTSSQIQTSSSTNLPLTAVIARSPVRPFREQILLNLSNSRNAYFITFLRKKLLLTPSSAGWFFSILSWARLCSSGFRRR